jgi:hypothetical protein
LKVFGGLILILLFTASCAQPKGSNEDLTGDGISSRQPSGILNTCSKLTVPDESISKSLTTFDRKALVLALSISGSFEGAEDWANISDDFDGQGLSLGLLNQNLGTGSLQPLLIRMRDNHFTAFQSYFNQDQIFKVEAMLGLWQSDTSVIKQNVVYSGFDQPPQISITAPNWNALSSANAKAATWARTNLYSNNFFDSGWKNSLQSLARDPNYVKQQIRSSLYIHNQTKLYMKKLGLRDLRSYLFLYDINTQNGGLYDEDIRTYLNITKNQKLSSEAALNRILSLRLQHVRGKYRADVKARKLAIIEGKGFVHGEDRNLEQEYCYKGSQSYSSH